MRHQNFYRAGGRFSIFTGCLLFFGVFLGIAMSAIIFNHLRPAILRHRYTEQTFVIESVRFAKMTQRGKANVPFAEGTVNGNHEKISLLDFDVEAESLADLEQNYPTGSHLDILYDPSASTMLTQGRTLRVIPPSSSLNLGWIKALGLTLIPGSLLLAGGIGQFICVKQRQRILKTGANKSEMATPRKPSDQF